MKLAGSCWESIGPLPVTVDCNEIEDLFCQKAISRRRVSGVGVEAKEDKRQKKEIVKLIDAKRAYAVDIGLARFRMTHEAIRKAIVRMDEKVFDQEQLAALVMLVPSPEDMDVLNNYLKDTGSEADVKSLEASARFFFALRDVVGTPDLQTRVNLFMFKQQFLDTVRQAEATLTTVVAAAAALRNSKGLALMFRLLLEIGNFLNGGSGKGRAYGFKLNVLGQLRSTKTVDGKMNLLQYVVKVVDTRCPGAADFVSELEPVLQASKVESSFVAATVSRVALNVNKLEAAIAIVTKHMEADESVGVEDCFVEVMTRFIGTAQPKLEALQQLHQQAVQQCEELCEYFGEERGKLTWDQLFEKFSDFVRSFQQAQQQVKRSQEMEITQAKRRSAEALAKANLQAKKDLKDKKKKKKKVKEKDKDKKKKEKEKKKIDDMVGSAIMMHRKAEFKEFKR